MEQISRLEDGAKPTPKHVLRLGFSTANSTLIMGSAGTDVCFDMEGMLLHEKQKTPLGVDARYARGCVMGVLLNLDRSSPNAYSVSLFKDGKRVCQPQTLPDSLQGKTLFPTVNYRNVAVSLNFSSIWAPLPFTCSMVQDALVSQSVVSKAEESACEVVFPCCLPEHGAFDWLDIFKAKNPHYTELSAALKNYNIIR